MFPRISNMKPFLKEKKHTYDTYKVFVFFILYSLSSLKEKKKKNVLKKNLVSHICKLFKSTCLFDKDCHLVIACYTNLNVYTNIYL